MGVVGGGGFWCVWLMDDRAYVGGGVVLRGGDAWLVGGRAVRRVGGRSNVGKQGLVGEGGEGGMWLGMWKEGGESLDGGEWRRRI